jgi:L-amino acid N-acyltransferase YncA
VDAEPRPLTVRALRPDDWPAVRAIYEQGIRSGDATHAVGIRERLGELRGHWRDVVLLERRSTLVGT